MCPEEFAADAVESEESSEIIEESGEELELASDSDLDGSSEEGESVSVEAETKEELVEEIEDAVKDGATKEEVVSMIEEFELKVNGKTIKKSLDLGDKEAVKRELQKAAAGQQSMQKEAELKKLIESEFGRLKDDPWAVLKEIGIDPDELAEQRVRDKVEQLKKTPDEIEREEMQKEIERLRKSEQEREQELKTAKDKELYEQASVELEDEMLQALESDPELPNTPKTISKIADAMIWAEKNGFENVKAHDVLPAVKEELQREMNDFFKDKPVDFLEKFIGKQTMENMRKQRVAAARKARTAKVPETAKEVAQKKNERISSKDFFKRMQEKINDDK